MNRGLLGQSFCLLEIFSGHTSPIMPLGDAGDFSPQLQNLTQAQQQRLSAFAAGAVNGITAFAGGGQTNATLLTGMINRVTTVATAADSVKLPVGVPGMEITVINGAANSMNLFPATGDAINALGANAAFAIAAAKVCTCFCTNANQWHTQLTA